MSIGPDGMARVARFLDDLEEHGLTGGRILAMHPTTAAALGLDPKLPLSHKGNLYQVCASGWYPPGDNLWLIGSTDDFAEE